MHIHKDLNLINSHVEILTIDSLFLLNQRYVEHKSYLENALISIMFYRNYYSFSMQNTNCKNSQNFAIVDDYYDNEFPPIFNISLWLMIILVLTVYAVAVVMWYMDPGRDSVIYRVTSQRMKSE